MSVYISSFSLSKVRSIYVRLIQFVIYCLVQVRSCYVILFRIFQVSSSR